MGNMFQCKIDEIFNDMLNVFGIADDILVINYDENGEDLDTAVNKVLWRAKEVNLHPFLWRGDIKKRSTTGPQKRKAFTDMLAPNNKKELKLFFDILTILEMFLQVQLMCVIHSSS